MNEAVRKRARWSGPGGRPAPVTALPTRPPTKEIGLTDILAFARRRRMLIAMSIAICAAIGILYAVTTPPQYSASAVLVIDARKVEIFDKGDVSTAETIPNAAVETELQIVRSKRIANAVVDKLKLDQNAEFMAGDPLPFGRLVALIPESAPAAPSAEAAQPDPAAEARAKRRARALLGRNLQVQRAGLSYAIGVTFVSSDPHLASSVANAVLDAYLQDQVERKVETAQKLSSWLQGRIADLRTQGFDADLQAREKSAFRATYNEFLQRYTQALQQETVPTTQAAIISPAEPPSGPSWPNLPLILAGSLVAGTMLGLGSALARDLLDRAIRQRSQLEALTGVPCLGVLPRFRLKRRDRRRAAKLPDPASDARTFSAGPQLDLVGSAPWSRFAETLRSVRVAAENAPDGPMRVLGVVSSVASEGKTTVAANLAQLVAQSERALLIDADFRNPTLTSSLVPPGSAGLAQLVANGGEPDDVLWTDARSGLSFLPTGTEARQADGREILASSGMERLMERFRSQFDFIVVDLPPVLPVVDARAASHLLDSFAFIVEWGVTTDEIVTHAIREGNLEGRVIGTVLNKIVPSRLRRFEGKTVSRAMQGYLEHYRHVA